MQSPDIQNEDRSNDLYITISILTFAITVTTILRIVAKLKRWLLFGWDDYFIILGTCLDIVASGFDVKATKSGFGRHSQFLSEDELVNAVKYSQLAVIVATFAIWAIKLFVCFFLLAIIKGSHHRVFRWAIRGLIVFNTVDAFIVALLWGLQASPLPKLWDSRIPGTRKSPQSFLDITYVNYSFGLFTDVFYAASPIFFLWKVNISKKRKITILALTGSCILVTAVAVLIIIFAPEFLQIEDITWAEVNEFICDVIERNFSGFIANLPAIWYIITRIKDTKSSSHPSGATSGGLPTYRSTKYLATAPQTLTTISSVTPSKPRPSGGAHEPEWDDCIPLYERESETSNWPMDSRPSLSNDGNAMPVIAVRNEVDVAWSSRYSNRIAPRMPGEDLEAARITHEL